MESRKFAPRIVIDWDPVTDDGHVRLDFYDFLMETGTNNPTSYLNPNKRLSHEEDLQTLGMRLGKTDNIIDPVTGAPLPNRISGAAAMEIIKKITNEIIDHVTYTSALNHINSNMTINELNEVTIDISNSDFTDIGEFVEMSIDWGDGDPIQTVNTLNTSHAYNPSNGSTTYNINVDISTTNHQSLTIDHQITVHPL